MPCTVHHNFFINLHHERLKAQGYKKARYTFSREMYGYTERIQFQGSSWNNLDNPWSFYINLGVEFADLPPRTPCRDFPGTHCWTRIEHIVPGAPSEYDLPETPTAVFAAELAAYLDCASRQVARQIRRIRRRYEERRSPRLTIAA
jgi:hypothetical protein